MLSIIVIAIIGGVLAGIVGSPGFALVVPLLFIFGVITNFKQGLGIYFIGIIIPVFVNSIMYAINNKEHINIKLSILFSIIFAICSALSIYFCKHLPDGYKFCIAGTLQLIIGIWYLQYGYSLYKTI